MDKIVINTFIVGLDVTLWTKITSRDDKIKLANRYDNLNIAKKKWTTTWCLFLFDVYCVYPLSETSHSQLETGLVPRVISLSSARVSAREKEWDLRQYLSRININWNNSRTLLIPKASRKPNIPKYDCIHNTHIILFKRWICSS